MNPLENTLGAMGARIGSNARFMSILIATLHNEGIINGRAVAQSIRLDGMSDETYRLSVADLIVRTIEGVDDAGAIQPRAIE
jgi:hypothetical protein